MGRTLTLETQVEEERMNNNINNNGKLMILDIQNQKCALDAIFFKTYLRRKHMQMQYIWLMLSEVSIDEESSANAFNGGVSFPIKTTH